MVRRERRAALPRRVRHEERLADWLDSQAKEIAALRRGDHLPAGERSQSVDALLDVFLEKHGRIVDRATGRKLRTQLRQARQVFGDRHPESLRRIELEDWRSELPAGSRHDVFRAFRQALAWGCATTDRHADPVPRPARRLHRH
jgi:hypothetical protein